MPARCPDHHIRAQRRNPPDIFHGRGRRGEIECHVNPVEIGLGNPVALAVRFGRQNQPDVEAALRQQLGLKLERAKEAVDMLIIESALRKPSVP